MMIDVDRYKSNNKDVNDTLHDIKGKLSRHPELFFRIYSSRNGYHIFVLNKSMDYKSDESIRLMFEIGCDFYYIVYSYLRGWSVRLNKKKGEENVEELYRWVGDVVMGNFFSMDSFASMGSSDNEMKMVNIGSVKNLFPDERLEVLTNLHIELVDVFREVGLCSMPAPI